MYIAPDQNPSQQELEDLINQLQVNHFKYLGVEKESDGKQEKEINTRIEKTIKLLRYE